MRAWWRSMRICWSGSLFERAGSSWCVLGNLGWIGSRTAKVLRLLAQRLHLLLFQQKVEWVRLKHMHPY